MGSAGTVPVLLPVSQTRTNPVAASECLRWTD